jgi:hypothetical protein
MAGPYNPPVKNEDCVFKIGLRDVNDHNRLKANPTIAAGDFKIDKDDGGFNNLATLPTVSPAAGKAVKISLSAAEMNADVVTIIASDQTDPPEWADTLICIPTVASA